MTLTRIRFVALMALAVSISSVSARARLTRYESAHYTIHTDLDAATVREAKLRLTRMFEEYTRRTSAFTVRINERLPFYLFSKHADYLAAGGVPGSAGVFTGDRLMATMDPAAGSFSWSVVQHEGFHQFVDRVIGSNIPVWVDEGLAEYFGEAVFTGDGYVTGLIPRLRLARIKTKIARGRFPPLAEMMRVDRALWNARMHTGDYDQAWSMVHFLAHAEDGKYERPFNGFLRDAGRTGVWDKAWVKHFGPGTVEFEAAWKKYWLDLPDDPTADLYAKATVTTLTSFLARAVSRGREFASVEAFIEQAKAGGLGAHKEDWLPPALLAYALDRMSLTGECSLTRRSGKRVALSCTAPSGTKLIGTFTIRKGRVTEVTVNMVPN